MKSGLMLLFLSVSLGACGQIFLKVAVGKMGEIRLNWPELPGTVLQILGNPWTLAGICFFVTSMILWVKVISGMELSKAYPSISFSYIIVFIVSVLFFKEAVTFSKVFGFVLILAGVFFLHQ